MKGSLQQLKGIWLYNFMHIFHLRNIATKMLLFLLDGHVLPKKNLPAVSTVTGFDKTFFLFK